MTETIDNQRWPLNTILVSREHRVLYTPIAKNANTSLKRMFVQLSGKPEKEDLRKVHHYLDTRQTGMILGDYTPQEATAILADESYYSYVVLRDPMARAVSGYLEKFVINPLPAGANGEAPPITGDCIDWVYQQRDEQPDYQRSISFSEFVQYVSHIDDFTLDTHFKSQASYLVDQRFDFTGTMERMERVIEVLETCFGQTIDLEHHNPTKRSKPLFKRRRLSKMLPAQLRALRKMPHDSELITKRLKTKLENRYAEDKQRWLRAMA